jgi:putative flippase GtrA
MSFHLGMSMETIRFGVVGVASNLVLYFLYLLFTYFGMGHKESMTILFLIGVTQTFFLNKNWTFRHGGAGIIFLKKYALVYLIAYLINLLALYFFVDYHGFHHEYVQAIAILVIAFYSYMAQRFWVFV